MDTSKPFIGYKSAGRRPESQNDREGAKGAPLAAIRGWIAGTAGLPGDLEGLVRMLPGIERKEPVLPTSDFYKEWLPLRGESAVERAFTEAGSLAGGAGVGTTVRAAKTGVSAGARGALGAVQAAARNAAVPRTLSPQAGVIKMKGGNWLDGSVEEALKGLRPSGPAHRDEALMIGGHWAKNVDSPEVVAEIAKNEAFNQWLDKKLARYVKNEMATPEDPVRALAERGILHVPPEQVGVNRYKAQDLRSKWSTDQLGVSPAARAWEDASDVSVTPSTIGQVSRSGNVEPWMSKLGSTDRVYSTSKSVEGLGFSHLIDELRNATNPESGLPRELLLKYDALDRVTVPQAVERVAKINEWRAAQMAEANAAKANNAATVLHKEYPEAGYRWVELKKQGLPEGWMREGEAYVDPANPSKWVYPDQALQDALKYEGDTMGHCVGGYCDDVASGKSRIYSLRDKKGQPHTTIEIAPERSYGTEHLNRFSEQAYNELVKEGLNPGTPDDMSSAFLSAMNKRTADLAEANLPQRIVQIKGKQNRAPNPEYLPYVQDFVRSGKWSDVGDLHNSGLVDLQGMRDVPEHLKSGSRFLTQSEYDDAVREFIKQRDGAEPGFARGGAVNVHDYDPNRVDALVQTLEAELQ